MTPRMRNHRESWNLTVTDPISGNFYPMTSGAHITDGSTTLALVTDRAQGVASLEDGQLEVMVHRQAHFGHACRPFSVCVRVVC